MNQAVKRRSAWIFVMLWMGLIFYLSHQPADQSSALSTGLLKKIIELFETITNISLSDVSWMHYFIRKGAHLFAYFILAILLFHACKQMGWKRVVQITVALLGSALYAATDEIHQLYIPGRSGEVNDVLIDTTGAAIGILVCMLFEKILAHEGTS